MAKNTARSTRASLGTLATRELDIERVELAESAASLATLQPGITYAPSQWYWRKAARATQDPEKLRSYIDDLLQALEAANRALLSAKYLPGKTRLAPGEPLRSHEDWLAREGYRVNGETIQAAS